MTSEERDELYMEGLLMTYTQALEVAQERADKSGIDHGVFGPDHLGGWLVRSLPRRGSRFGVDARCEVRMCSDLAKCLPGHGPEGYAP